VPDIAARLIASEKTDPFAGEEDDREEINQHAS
jgi:hypothetical protein